jgi:DNA-binding transcriptional regulator YiaG
MSETSPQRETTSVSDPAGIISGTLLREMRRRVGRHQGGMAALLGVDLGTYRSWENGSRPLANTKVDKLRALTHGLIRIGAEAELVALIDTAIDVDLAIRGILSSHHPGGGHPLASLVQTRTWNDLLAWGIAAKTPRALQAGGQVVTPRLAAADRSALLNRLRDAAEQTGTRIDATSTLLRRQVYFVASWDHSGPGKDWLARMEAREYGRIRLVDGWTPVWVAGRSLAVAKAVSGDPDQLRYFIAHQLAGDDQEVANLNYWANWAGEDTRPALSDEFMRTPDLGCWRGTELLRQLTAGMQPTTPYIDLTVHTVRALLKRRPWLLNDDPRLTADLRQRTYHLLEHPQPLSGQARYELELIHTTIDARRTP